MEKRIVRLAEAVTDLRSATRARPVVTPTDLNVLRDLHATLGRVIDELATGEPLVADRAQVSAAAALPPDAWGS